ncbi:hypothetical protein GCM10012320_18410 [Sinomonas cellulolyticus]|uniref:DUF429 domain-containing protein n=1 Tax=Sinomonas cellulolyticus TaxID=2801916 RepID=A0ABS1K788_9MICC|nr:MULTISPECIES: DUF429 domain-containing protein [Sinomonas]MBL0707222.1 DUF429 domain-containing protein [Sinomonas cellulolyticus]GHG50108.1 hypothetical protein GCM10012320_18410 [Sinomonas sp. KCTC 49339]
MKAAAIGIDVALIGGRGHDLVALDSSRRIVESIRHIRDLGLLKRTVDALAPDVVCIDSPSQWAERGVRRPAELDLTRRGINLYATPSEDRVRQFHLWMRDGMAVYAALADDYPRYTGGSVLWTAAEFYPHASAVALAGHIGEFTDKVRFRRQVLATQGIKESELAGADLVDAAVGALTGLIALEGAHTWVGEDRDAMLIPVRELHDRYERVPATPAHSSRRETPRRVVDENRRECQCGCGGPPARPTSRFLPGHDNRINPATGQRWNGLPVRHTV